MWDSTRNVEGKSLSTIGESIKSSEGCSCRAFSDRPSTISTGDIVDPRSYPFLPPSPPPPPRRISQQHFDSTTPWVSPFPSLCGEPMHDAGEKETPPSNRHVVVRKPLLPAPCVRSVSRAPSCWRTRYLPSSEISRSAPRVRQARFPELFRCDFRLPAHLRPANMRVADHARRILARQSDRWVSHRG